MKISELNPNPYKKEINAGKLDEKTIEKLISNMDDLGLMGALPIVERKHKYYLVNGHHRLEAIRRIYGDSYNIEVTLHKYSDAQLLKGMVIENLTQRKNDFREELENIQAVKKYLEINKLSELRTTSQGKRTDLPERHIGSREISDFLQSVICKTDVSLLLRIKKNIPQNLIDTATDKQGDYNENRGLRKDQLDTLSKIENKEEVEQLATALLKSENQRVLDHRKFVKQYIEAPEEIKKQVRDGEIDIADVEFESEKQELTEKAEERPLTIFMPNFTQRMHDFDKNVKKLEKQIELFSTIFRSTDFKTRYDILKTKQREKLNYTIFNIKERIQNCQDEIDFFMKQLPDNVILLEVKK